MSTKGCGHIYFNSTDVAAIISDIPQHIVGLAEIEPPCLLL
jgi:hypothetical protein